MKFTAATAVAGVLPAGAVQSAAKMLFPEPQKSPGKINIRWLGTAGVEITYERETILIDPYFSRVGKIPTLIGRPEPQISIIQAYLAGLPAPPTAIIAGHTHVDHALDIPELTKNLNGPLIGSQSLETLMTICGLPGRVRVCQGGERVELSPVAAVTMIRSLHGLVFFGRALYPGEIDPQARRPLTAADYKCGTVFIPKLKLGGKTFLHAGSANFIAQELEGHECDILFMCLPGWKKLLEYTSRFLSLVKPKMIIPIHYDDFTVALTPTLNPPRLPFQDLNGFIAALRKFAPDAEIWLPKPFQTITI